MRLRSTPTCIPRAASSRFLLGTRGVTTRKTLYCLWYSSLSVMSSFFAFYCCILCVLSVVCFLWSASAFCFYGFSRSVSMSYEIDHERSLSSRASFLVLYAVAATAISVCDLIISRCPDGGVWCVALALAAPAPARRRRSPPHRPPPHPPLLARVCVCVCVCLPLRPCTLRAPAPWRRCRRLLRPERQIYI